MRRSLLSSVLTLLFLAGLALPAAAQSYRYQFREPPRVSEPVQAGPDFDRRRHRPHHRRDRDIHILSAWYGVEQRACNATRDLRRACENRSSCTVRATNRLCGDPVPNVVKVLTVHYRCERERPRSITRWEGSYLGINCRR